MPINISEPPLDASTQEGLELLSAFSQINDRNIRRTVITMVQALLPQTPRSSRDQEASLSAKARQRKLVRTSDSSSRSPPPPR